MENSKEDQKPNNNTNELSIFTKPPLQAAKVISALEDYLQKIDEMKTSKRELMKSVVEMCPENWPSLNQLSTYLEDQAEIWQLARDSIGSLATRLSEYQIQISDAHTSLRNYHSRKSEMQSMSLEYENMLKRGKMPKMQATQIKYMVSESERAMELIKGDTEKKVMAFVKSRSEIGKELLDKFEDAIHLTYSEGLLIVDLIMNILRSIPKRKVNVHNQPKEDVELVSSLLNNIAMKDFKQQGLTSVDKDKKEQSKKPQQSQPDQKPSREKTKDRIIIIKEKNNCQRDKTHVTAEGGDIQKIKKSKDNSDPMEGPSSKSTENVKLQDLPIMFLKNCSQNLGDGDSFGKPVVNGTIDISQTLENGSKDAVIEELKEKQTREETSSSQETESKSLETSCQIREPAKTMAGRLEQGTRTISLDRKISAKNIDNNCVEEAHSSDFSENCEVQESDVKPVKVESGDKHVFDLEERMKKPTVPEQTKRYKQISIFDFTDFRKRKSKSDATVQEHGCDGDNQDKSTSDAKEKIKEEKDRKEEFKDIPLVCHRERSKESSGQKEGSRSSRRKRHEKHDQHKDTSRFSRAERLQGGRKSNVTVQFLDTSDNPERFKEPPKCNQCFEPKDYGHSDTHESANVTRADQRLRAQEANYTKRPKEAPRCELIERIEEASYPKRPKEAPRCKLIERIVQAPTCDLIERIEESPRSNQTERIVEVPRCSLIERVEESSRCNHTERFPEMCRYNQTQRIPEASRYDQTDRFKEAPRSKQPERRNEAPISNHPERGKEAPRSNQSEREKESPRYNHHERGNEMPWSNERERNKETDHSKTSNEISKTDHPDRFKGSGNPTQLQEKSGHDKAEPYKNQSRCGNPSIRLQEAEHSDRFKETGHHVRTKEGYPRRFQETDRPGMMVQDYPPRSKDVSWGDHREQQFKDGHRSDHAVRAKGKIEAEASLIPNLSWTSTEAHRPCDHSLQSEPRNSSYEPIHVPTFSLKKGRANESFIAEPKQLSPTPVYEQTNVSKEYTLSPSPQFAKGQPRSGRLFHPDDAASESASPFKRYDARAGR